jgi:hypothetical protein
MSATSITTTPVTFGSTPGENGQFNVVITGSCVCTIQGRGDTSGMGGTPPTLEWVDVYVTALSGTWTLPMHSNMRIQTTGTGSATCVVWR